VILEPRRPAVKAGPAWLFPPPGGFLQASAVAEANLVRLVTEAAAGARAIADLFAGSGTFSLPLAAIAPVYAAESSAEALTALAQAAHAPGLKPVRTERRDLFRRPLTRQELARFDLVVMDPPRAGAEVQSRELAASSVRRAVMVSCNPQTLARDLRLLVSGGFQLTRVTPVDQFLYSPHMETVAVLKR
jgi:23S rRNA (uracil1939-C5)-methyltransferase